MCKVMSLSWLCSRFVQGSFCFISFVIFSFSLWHFKENHFDQEGTWYSRSGLGIHLAAGRHEWGKLSGFQFGVVRVVAFWRLTRQLTGEVPSRVQLIVARWKVSPIWQNCCFKRTQKCRFSCEIVTYLLSYMELMQTNLWARFVQPMGGQVATSVVDFLVCTPFVVKMKSRDSIGKFGQHLANQCRQ